MVADLPSKANGALMNAQAVLTELQRLGKPKTIKIYERHGVTGLLRGELR